MGTHAYIGFVDENHGIIHTQGIFVHNDGYPSGVGVQLYALVQQYERLDWLKAVLYQHPSYSILVGWNGSPDDIISFSQSNAAFKEARGNFDKIHTLCESGCAVHHDDKRHFISYLDLGYAHNCDYSYLIYAEHRYMVVLDEKQQKIGLVDFDQPLPDWMAD